MSIVDDEQGRRRGSPSRAGIEARFPVAGVSPAVLDGDDLDEITVEDAVEDLEREIVDEAVAHTELLGDRGQKRPALWVRDDILDRFIHGERESLTEACA